MGVGRLRQYAEDIERPLITIDPPGYGTSVRKSGQSVEDLSHEYVDCLRGLRLMILILQGLGNRRRGGLGS